MNARLILLFLIFASFSALMEAQECSDCVTTPAYGLSAEQIEAIAIHQPKQLTVDTKLLNDRWYKRVNTSVNIHNAPNGDVVRHLDEGFNFVTVLEERDGWTLINKDEWVQTEFLSDVNWGISKFTGIFLPEETQPYTYAWALVNMYPSSAPGESPRESLGMIYRYTLLTIFAEHVVDGISWFQISDGKWVHQHRVARVIPTERPESVTTNRWISIDLYEQVLVVHEGEKALFATLVATGLPRWPTYEGTFNIYYRNPREFMSWGVVGDDFYALEEVPWTMFFDGGRALHGAYWHDGFGYRRSHGCVNLSITDAKWLYDWVAEDMGSKRSVNIEKGPNVYVYSSGVYQN
jgi:hypothetical protein